MTLMCLFKNDITDFLKQVVKKPEVLKLSSPHVQKFEARCKISEVTES